MAKSEKKISIASLDKVVKNDFDNHVIGMWHDIEVKMIPNISFTDTLEFVDDVVTICMSDMNGFLPEIMDFAIKSNILSRYANFSLPDNLDHRHEIIYHTDAVAFVCQHINMEQLREITASIDRKLKYLCDTNVVNIQKRITELVSAFEDMQQKTSEMFGKFTPDDMVKIMSALEGGKFDENKIVEAYLNKTSPEEADT